MQVTDLDKFTRAYLTTALWSSTDDNDIPLDRKYTIDDLPAETLAKAAKDCTEFRKQADFLIGAAIATGKVQYYPPFDEIEQAGHDFWLTRNGHGAGFWDGDWPEPYGEQLTAIAHKFTECNLIVDDDEKLYLE